MTRKVFVDLDGVLADMAGGYLARFGVAIPRDQADPKDLWANVNSTPSFFADLSPMADAFDLLSGIKTMGIRPIVLSGVSEKCPDAPEQKRQWVRRWIGKDTPMIFCKASEKCLFGHAGDVLIDDWTRHQAKWEAIGGVFIVHTSAALSLDALEARLAEAHPSTAESSTRNVLAQMEPLLRIRELLHPTDTTYCAEPIDIEDARWLLAEVERLTEVQR